LALSAGFEPAISGVRFRDPGPLDDDSVIEKQRDQETKWLLEQGSNLQALRHLISSQARLPNSAIQDQNECARLRCAVQKNCGAKYCAANNPLRRAAWRAHHQNVVVAPDLKYDLPTP
jgi:hypothetical protein